MQIWNVKNILEWAIDYFNRKDIPQPRLSAELLLSSVLDLDRINLYLNYNRILNKQELATYKKYILKRLEHTPIQYILNEAYFRKIKLYVDKEVLIPRPETELIVEKAFQILKDSLSKDKINILEIGTGSGAITISLAYEISNELKLPDELWEIVSTDNNPGALAIAENNARNILGNEKFNNIKFIECDIVPQESSDFFKQYINKINLVISNPPYISEKDYENLSREVKEYEPKNALLGGKTGLEVYEKILYKIKPYLCTGFCHILFEIDSAQSAPLKKLSEDIISPAEIKIDKDYNQRERIMTIKV
ncbi:protein-(glutamine-N5) methyltransferase, release factor-specific [Candidatus Atribacteria bacterium RBG_16_35_8]|nr:MAG: protein-(glutamine-N5) methyltransferase, release factor-specific [Candidatus Atribacteria bacterium RBG_16_35_8]